jgi:hypothetical protein
MSSLEYEPRGCPTPGACSAANIIESLQEQCDSLERERFAWEQLAKQRAEPDPELKAAQDLIRKAAKRIGKDSVYQCVAKFEAALKEITAPGFGLDPMASDEEALEYWRNQATTYRGIARQALTSSEKAGERAPADHAFLEEGEYPDYCEVCGKHKSLHGPSSAAEEKGPSPGYLSMLRHGEDPQDG